VLPTVRPSRSPTLRPGVEEPTRAQRSRAHRRPERALRRPERIVRPPERPPAPPRWISRSAPRATARARMSQSKPHQWVGTPPSRGRQTARTAMAARKSPTLARVGQGQRLCRGRARAPVIRDPPDLVSEAGKTHGPRGVLPHPADPAVRPRPRFPHRVGPHNLELTSRGRVCRSPPGPPRCGRRRRIRRRELFSQSPTRLRQRPTRGR
jgi:hypothetical protein